METIGRVEVGFGFRSALQFGDLGESSFLAWGLRA